MMTLPIHKQQNKDNYNNEIHTFTVTSDSMSPTYNPGETLFYKQCNTPEREGVYLVCVNGMTLLRRIQFDFITKDFVIFADNLYQEKQLKELFDFEIIGIIIGKFVMYA